MISVADPNVGFYGVRMGALAHAAARVAPPVRRQASAAFALAAVAVGSLGAAHGGYFATSWGWAIVASAAATAWAVSLGEPLPPTRTASVFLGALGVLAAWFALSSLWDQGTQAIAETARALVYVAVGCCAVVVVRRAAVGHLLGGLLAGATAVALYALGTRLFPDRIATFDPVATYRLATPIGYWNALGLLSAVALLIALALVSSVESRWRAALAAVPAPVLAAVVYFTFSRGSWIALGIGLAVTLAVARSRVRLTIGAVALAAPSALAVLLASRSEALARQGAALTSAAEDGRRLALVILVLVVVAAALGAVVVRAPLFARAERGYGIALVVAAAAALAVVAVRAGGPIDAVERAWDSFAAPPPKTQVDLRKRLFSFSGNGRVTLWRAAIDEFRANPIVGGGAGSFEQYWLQNRDVPMKVRDAHSLYIETLGELGIVGLVLLVAALGTPLVVGIRRRNVVTGAYAAYLVHAGVDWDWEITSVTLLGLLASVAILAEARTGGQRTLGPRARAAVLTAAVAVGAFGFVFLVGNMFLSRASAAADDGRFAAAAKRARTASSWLPWSTEPWRRLGEAELAQGRTANARAAFATAIKKDRSDWSLWLDLARAGDRSALAQAKRLNPLSPEIRRFEKESAGISIGVGG